MGFWNCRRNEKGFEGYLAVLLLPILATMGKKRNDILTNEPFELLVMSNSNSDMARYRFKRRQQW